MAQLPIPSLQINLLFYAILSILACLNWLIVLLASSLYLSMAWASFRYFRADDVEAKSGQKWLSIGASLAMAATVWQLWQIIEVSIPIAVATTFLYCGGLTMFWWAFLTTRKSRMDFAFSGRPPHLICRRGPYAFMRHPYYCAYLLGWFAPVVYLRNLPALLVFLAMAAAYWRAALKEERLIGSSSLAQVYAEHTARMGPSVAQLLSRWSRRLAFPRAE